MASFRSALNEKCKECIYDKESMGTWRQQVTLCNCDACPLWKLRPITEESIPMSVIEFYCDSPEEREHYCHPENYMIPYHKDCVD